MANRECRRCGIPHYESEGAASSGGMGRLIEFRDGLCGVCQDYRDQRKAEILEWVLWWRRQNRNSGGRRRQASVTEYE